MARTDIYVYTEATSLTSALITGETNTTAKAFPPVTLGDSVAFDFRFTDGTAYTAWAGDASYSLELSVRALGSDSAPWVYVAPASCTPIAGEGWTATLPLTTNALYTAMKAVNISQANPNFRTYLHIRVTNPSGGVESYAIAPLVVKYSAYSQVLGTTPTQPPQFLWKRGNSLGNLYGITALTGGGLAALDGVVTLGAVTTGAAVLTTIGGSPQIWKLSDGTDAEDGIYVVRPDDYDSETNARVWKLQY